jgi:hypothetical protein
MAKPSPSPVKVTTRKARGLQADGRGDSPAVEDEDVGVHVNSNQAL